jgi:hypothetical protein
MQVDTAHRRLRLDSEGLPGSGRHRMAEASGLLRQGRRALGLLPILEATGRRGSGRHQDRQASDLLRQGRRASGLRLIREATERPASGLRQDRQASDLLRQGRRASGLRRQGRRASDLLPMHQEDTPRLRASDRRLERSPRAACRAT